MMNLWVRQRRAARISGTPRTVRAELRDLHMTKGRAMAELPAEIDTSRPHPARIYDYCLGGKNHFAADREIAEKALARVPAGRTAARENRAFLGRAVRYLAEEAGVRQFLDIGTGLPAAGNVHEVAQSTAPESRVVYVDNDQILSEDENPAARVRKPRRLRSARMPLPDSRLNEIGSVAGSTGNDPALDSLIIRLHTETACRRGGALALTAEDLDPEQCLIRLHEKGGTDRWQPVSPTLMTHLLAHAENRGGLHSGERLLRYPDGTPITSRRYDHLWKRLGEHLPWVETQQVSTHWIRHTVLTWVERRFGFAVAQAYAGHDESNRGARAMGATGTYVRAGLPEVATALSALTGEPHPLAPEGPRADVNHA
jgi:integrase